MCTKIGKYQTGWDVYELPTYLKEHFSDSDNESIRTPRQYETQLLCKYLYLRYLTLFKNTHDLKKNDHPVDNW